jgi:hypothetical protein
MDLLVGEIGLFCAFVCRKGLQCMVEMMEFVEFDQIRGTVDALTPGDFAALIMTIGFYDTRLDWFGEAVLQRVAGLSLEQLTDVLELMVDAPGLVPEEAIGIYGAELLDACGWERLRACVCDLLGETLRAALREFDEGDGDLSYAMFCWRRACPTSCCIRRAGGRTHRIPYISLRRRVGGWSG